MINAGDRIAVGVSGGKDSVAMLMALNALKRFYPVKFEIEAIAVSLGYKEMDFTPIEKLCSEIGVNYNIVYTDIGDIIFKERKEKNPCSLCSKMRKGALNSKAKELNCNKVALGHNRDDFIETFFMSLFYEGRLYTFNPVTYLDRMDIYSVRPLIYVPEKDIKSFVKEYGINTVKNKCPVDGYTRREEIKKFISQQTVKYDHFHEKVFGAIKRANLK